MTAEQAKQALKEGKKVRCVKWWSAEFIRQGILDQSNEGIDECIFEDYKDDDWEIVE